MVKIECSPLFLPGLCLLAWFDPLGAFRPFLIAAALHELGHAAAIWLLGGRIDAVRLGFGDACIRTGFLTYRTETLCALAGPAANILCFAAFCTRFSAFAEMSLLLGAYNLLPVWPLDGARVLRAALLSQGKSLIFLWMASAGTAMILLGAAYWAAARFETGLWPVLAAVLLLARVLLAAMREKSVAFPGAAG